MSNSFLTDSLIHEIKNPISVMQLSLESIEDKLNEEDRDLSMLRKQIDKINNLLESYLSISREKNKSSEFVYFVDVIDEIIGESKDINNNINFIFDYIDDDLKIKGQYYHIKIVLSNIIINAIEAIKKTGNIKIILREYDGVAIIQVIDDGTGISKRDEKNILNSFYTTKECGTGIGLTIIKNILNIYDGDFSIVSLKKGAKVTVKLPL